jgi:hypothetical protein
MVSGTVVIELAVGDAAGVGRWEVQTMTMIASSEVTLVSAVASAVLCAHHWLK